jgi:pimeloyl-ACP methyl ester carboxylesterase
MKRLFGIVVKVALSVLFAGLFYTGWMVVAIPTVKSGFGGVVVKAVLWIIAPIVTGLGFAVGTKIFELLPTAKKSPFWVTYKWYLAGCAIGGGIVCIFGPMLIVFGMFLAGTLSVFLHEAFIMLNYPRYQHDMHAAQERLFADSQVIQTPSGLIEYASVGDGYPVLMVHGAGGGYDQGLILGEFLCDGFRQIAISRFGYLRTPIPNDTSPVAMADAYVNLLDELNINKVAVFGISRGGPSSLQFALRYPDRCSALVMMSAISYTPPPESLMQRIIFNLIFQSDFLYWLITTKFESQLISTFGVPKKTQAKLPATEKKWVSEFLQSMHPISLRKAGIHNDRKYKIHEHSLKHITVPTLVIHAEDDSLISFTQGQYTAQNIPDAQLITLQSGGHLLMGQHNKIKSVIYNFLKEHAKVEQ